MPPRRYAPASSIWGVKHDRARHRTGPVADRPRADLPLHRPVAPDLRVDFLSPAIGNGFDFGADVVGATDFAGDPRVIGAGIDIGAYEQ